MSWHPTGPCHCIQPTAVVWLYQVSQRPSLCFTLQPPPHVILIAGAAIILSHVTMSKALRHHDCALCCSEFRFLPLWPSPCVNVAPCVTLEHCINGLLYWGRRCGSVVIAPPLVLKVLNLRHQGMVSSELGKVKATKNRSVTSTQVYTYTAIGYLSIYLILIFYHIRAHIVLSQVSLERVLGLTASTNAQIALDSASGTLAYSAG